MAFNTGTVPLTQALPWSDNDDDDDGTNNTSCILVTDSVETDGRFLLHTLASQALAVENTASKNAAVLWLACGPLTETLVATAMRKMGCDAAASYLKKPTNNSNKDDWKRPLAIYSIQGALSKKDGTDNDDDFCADEPYLKNLYHRIKAYCCSCDDDESGSTATTLIVLDDVSSLSNLFGDRLVYFFLLYLRSIPNCRLVVRCSNDMDRELYHYDDTAPESSNEGHRQVDWVGAGGGAAAHNSDNNVSWERKLVELADWIVDVVPLASGYSREAHGRLVVTRNGSTATKPTSAGVPLVMNYCLQDTSVSAIRLKR